MRVATCKGGSFVYGLQGEAFLALLLLVIGTSASAFGQGTTAPKILATGGNAPLQTHTVTLTLDPQQHLPFVTIPFGFATDEIPAAGVILDSLSVSVRAVNGSLYQILATVDAAQVAVLPPISGGSSIQPGNVQVAPVAFPSLQPVYRFQQAFEMVLLLPQEVMGTPLDFYFDLFDNMSPVGSFGYHQDIQLSFVPEPYALPWAALVAAALFCRTRKHYGEKS